jgi:hypothetical protein
LLSTERPWFCILVLVSVLEKIMPTILIQQAVAAIFFIAIQIPQLAGFARRRIEFKP